MKLILPGLTPNSEAITISESPAAALARIVRTCGHVNLALALLSPQAQGKWRLVRPLMTLSIRLSSFVPKNKCSWFKQGGLSQR
jgi:hypothetical protein